MSVRSFIKKLLKLSFLKVYWYEFRSRNKELHVGVKPYKNGSRCPHCGRRGKLSRHMDARVWRDVVVCGIPLFFITNQKR